MKKIILGILIVAPITFAGCGAGNEASVSEDYKTSEPVAPEDKGPVGAGAGAGSGAGSNLEAPPPPAQ